MRERWAMLLPALLVLVLFVGLPAARVAQMSFQETDPSGEVAAQSAPLSNHVRLWEDERWWASLRTTFVFTAVSVLIETVLGIGFALVLHQRFGGRGLVRTAMMIPWVLPTAVMALAWGWIFNDAFGVFNDMLLRASILEAPVAWLGEPSTALAAMVIADVWKTTPFVALVVLAGLQGIPDGVIEAARVDGLTSGQRFFYVTLPLLAPSIAVALVFRAVQSYAAFDLPFTMTGGGPAGATETVSLYAYNAYFRYLDFGYASAMAVQGTAMVLITAALILRLARGRAA